MAKPRNILVITYWSLADGLVQAYVLPYLKIILEVLPAGSKVHLVTLESSPMTGTVQLPDHVIHHSFPYRPLGVGAGWMIAKLMFRLVPLVVSARIETIHAWCTPAGMIGHLLGAHRPPFGGGQL
ncbi:MAG: hypothetical protein IPN44_08855 [Flavobacteriales bacterium]|nr:hypothetical protein [Flavobacteriales bacterium]